MGLVAVVATMAAVLLLAYLVSRWDKHAAYRLLQHGQLLFESDDEVEPNAVLGARVARGNRARQDRGYLSPFLKKQIAFEQGWKCSCGCGATLQPDFHIDHTVPLWRGGKDTTDNMTAMNSSCHAKKTAIENKST